MIEVGTVVKDLCSDRIGVYLGEDSGLVRMVPVGGGLVWRCEAKFVRVATPLECSIAQAKLLQRTRPIVRP